MPTFSIIVPVFNVAPFLRQCLDSVLAQTCMDWECIAVDDGSSDGSSTILDEYARSDSRLHAIHQSNAGEGGARNAGLSVAKGDWIVFLDGDDLLAPDALNHIASLIDPAIDLIRFDYCMFSDGDGPSFHAAPANESTDIGISHSIEMADLFVLVPQHAFRRTILDGLRFTNYRRGCDRVFIDDVLLHRMDTVRVTDAVLYGYRQRPGSAMNSHPAFNILLDEMDHRLEIIRMIDESGKSVSYAGSVWLEGYFIADFPRILRKRKRDRSDLAKDWLVRLKALRHADGLSAFARFLSWFIPPFRPPMLAVFICICLDSGRRRVARLFHRTIGALP